MWTLIKNKCIGIATDLLVLPKYILITLQVFRAEPAMQTTNPNDCLIVFVHGFLHNKTGYLPFVKQLQQKTKQESKPITAQDIYSIQLGTPFTIHSIHTYARQLAHKLEQIRIKRNLSTLKVILVGHSMGGLVSAAFATQYAQQANIEVLRLISNGTPWHGSSWALLGCWSRCGQEMLPNHPFQRDLQQHIHAIKDKIFTIATPGDPLVPQKSALGCGLPIPEDHRFLIEMPLGHLALLESAQTQEINRRLIMEAWLEK